jgi:hypothetical protein
MLGTSNLAFDELRLSSGNFLNAGARYDLLSMFEIGLQTLLRECEHLLREFGGRRRSGRDLRAASKNKPKAFSA